MKIPKINKLLLVIIIAAAFLRLFKLGSVPPHLTSDEAALGYNAYSILKTGKDEYGEVLPMIFKSFGDYKPGLYIYLTVPSIAILGLNEYAVRLPGALAGIAAVYLIYQITNLLFPEKKTNLGKWKLNPGIFSAFVLAISPWHLHFSRGAWEVNVALTFILTGIYFFLRSIKKNNLLAVSAIFFALSVLTYQGAKLSAFIVLFILVLLHSNELRKFKFSTLFYSFLLGVFFTLPVLFSFCCGKTGRLEVFSVFSYPRTKDFIRNFLSEAHIQRNSIAYYIFYSEPLNFARGILGRLFNHFSGRFLFFTGDWQNMRHTPPYHGVMLLVDLIFLPLGIINLIRSKSLDKSKIFIFAWLVLSPLPAALSRDQVHAVRSLNMVIPLTMLSAYGLYWAVRKLHLLKNGIIKYAFYTAVLFAYLLSFVYYLDSYYIHLPNKQASLWFYGYKQTFNAIDNRASEYSEVTMQQSYSQPYIFYLFYSAYNPGKYQQQATLISDDIDVGIVEQVDNIQFRPIQFPDSTDREDVLYVYGPFNTYIDKSLYEGKVNVVKRIDYPNGNLAFILVEKL